MDTPAQPLARLVGGGIMPTRQAMTSIEEARRILEVEHACLIIEHQASPVGFDHPHHAGERNGLATALRVLGGYGFQSFDHAWAQSIAEREAKHGTR